MRTINSHAFKVTIVIFLGFWILTLVALHILGPPIEGVIAKITPLRAEYMVREQLAKFYLFVVILISIRAYMTLNEPIKIKISISFLLLCLTIYLSESNMITEEMQPICGLLLFGCTFFLLFKDRAWLTLLLLLLVMFTIAGGVITDFASENESVRAYLTEPVAIFLVESIGEETFDIISEGLICLLVIFYFLDTIEEFVRNNVIGTLSLLTASGILTVGNGFLHFQYVPNSRIVLGGLIITYAGFLGLVLTNRLIMKKGMTLALITEEHFYFFLFSFFVVLPTIYGNAGNKNIVSLVLWLPTIIFMGFYLYYRRSDLM